MRNTTTPLISTVFFALAILALVVFIATAALSFATAILPIAAQIALGLGSVAIGGMFAILAIFTLDD